MNLIRKYKCYKLISCLSETELDIFEFIDDKLKNLYKFENDKYEDRIFYMNSSGKCILEYILKNDYLYVRYDNFYGILEYKYKLNHSDIKSFLQYKIEKIYKLKIKKIDYTLSMKAIFSEEAYILNKEK